MEAQQPRKLVGAADVPSTQVPFWWHLAARGTSKVGRHMHAYCTSNARPPTITPTLTLDKCSTLSTKYHRIHSEVEGTCDRCCGGGFCWGQSRTKQQATLPPSGPSSSMSLHVVLLSPTTTPPSPLISRHRHLTDLLTTSGTLPAQVRCGSAINSHTSPPSSAPMPPHSSSPMASSAHSSQTRSGLVSLASSSTLRAQVDRTGKA